MTHSDILRQIYEDALVKVNDEGFIPNDIDAETKTNIDIILERSESNKGIMTVLITLLTHKIFDAKQDIRYHQAGMAGGFAGRGIDQQHITQYHIKGGNPCTTA